MKAERLIELLTKLRNELGQRASSDYAQLFGPGTIRKLSKLIAVIENLSKRFTDTTLTRSVDCELASIFHDAGIAAREDIHDSVESLIVVRDIITEFNNAANKGVFGGHEITFLTNDIKSWLSRDIENLQAVINNSPRN